jgi:hypothetical protein
MILQKLTAGVAAALLAVQPGLALADLSAQVIPYGAHQVGFTGEVEIGTLTSARTNLNNIWAGVSYRLECSDPNIRPVLTGGRSGSNNGFLGPKNIDVTAPDWFPSTLALPGWNRVPPGSWMDCVHFYTGTARSNIVPFGGGGTTFPIGGDAWEDSSSLSFTVVKPGTSFGAGCTP